MRLIDLCAGAGAITLHALGGPSVLPPVAWRGGKRRTAGATLEALDVHPGDVTEVVMVDASAWGWVWRAVLTDGEQVAKALEAWRGEDAEALWRRITSEPLRGSGPEDAARWLLVHGFSPRGKEATPGAPWKTAGFAGASMRAGGGFRHAPTSAASIAKRVRAARRTLAGRATVLHGDARCVGFLPGDRVVFDPPYHGTGGYLHDLPRADVLAIAESARRAGARVAVCEAEPLDLPGWHHLDLSHLGRRGAGREWLTLSHAPVIYQAALPLARTA